MEGKTRGFFTMATGKDEFYVLAHNLLVSYKFHTREPMPFAIICDRENPLTKDFDDVVIFSNPTRTYSDKLKMIELAPYDECIFIDADSLAYADLNGLWDVFRDAPPFGLLGDALPLDTKKAWLTYEDTGVFKDRIEQLIICQGGIYYMRKDCPADFLETVKYIVDHYLDFHFNVSTFWLSDETVFSLACAVHKYYPVSPWPDVFCFYPNVIKIKDMDIRTGTLDYRFYWQDLDKEYENGKYTFHWTTKQTDSWMYFRECERLLSAVAGRKPSALRMLSHYSGAQLRRLLIRLMPFKLKESLYNLLHR